MKEKKHLFNCLEINGEKRYAAMPTPPLTEAEFEEFDTMMRAAWSRYALSQEVYDLYGRMRTEYMNFKRSPKSLN